MEAARVRQVWECNLLEEMAMIHQLSNSFRYVSIDTEFPGTVFKPTLPVSAMLPPHHYSLMKKNVDATKLIQLGLTLSDSNSHYVWEFNFRDFDLDYDSHDPDSIALLQKQGIDLSKNRRYGISGRAFGDFFARMSGLVGRYQSRGHTWITFHGLYDFGYLIKMMTGKPLPEDIREFMWLVRAYLGWHVFDLKPIAHEMRLFGGLDKLAKALGLDRDGGKSHQAGSDSLMTMRTFTQLAVRHRLGVAGVLMRYTYVLYGLTWLSFRSW